MYPAHSNEGSTVRYDCRMAKLVEITSQSSIHTVTPFLSLSSNALVDTNTQNGNQTLRPPRIHTSFPYSGHDMNRTASYGSSDSGYGTRTPSIATSISQQGYPTQRYSFSRPLDQQSISSYDSDRRSHDIDQIQTPPLYAASTLKNRRAR